MYTKPHPSNSSPIDLSGGHAGAGKNSVLENSIFKKAQTPARIFAACSVAIWPPYAEAGIM